MIRSVVYIGNPRYYDMLLSASKSLLCNTPVDRIYFLIEDDAFPQPLPPIYQCINVRNQQYFRPHGPNVNGYYTYITLMRAALTKILPHDLDRTLLLDPDTIVTDNIDDLWTLDLSDYYFAAVQETRNHNHTKVPYFNAGVMLLNLSKLRSDHMDDRIIAEINNVRYQHMEQDVLNFLCDGHILPLPAEYNASHCTGPSETERIHHYVSYSKGQFYPNAEPYKLLSFDDISRKGVNIL